jgi:hypothetical protein
MMMRMLVVGTLPSAIEPAVTRLEDASQTVARGHDSGARPFPCLALSEGRVRPLEEAPVDVAVTVRNRAWPRPSPFEDGAICALRRRIPLVVAGITALYPFDRWSARTLEDGSDLVAACEQAAAAPLPRHGEVTCQAARQVLAAASRAPDLAAGVWRRQGGLQAEVTIPAGCADLTTKVAARITGALRQFDGFATAIDVRVTEAPTSPTSSQPPKGEGARS